MLQRITSFLVRFLEVGFARQKIKCICNFARFLEHLFCWAFSIFQFNKKYLRVFLFPTTALLTGCAVKILNFCQFVG